MNLVNRIGFHLLLLIGLATGAMAQFAGIGGGTKSGAEVRVEAKAIAPGKPFSVALELSHPDGWHSYYKNSGGVELPPTIEWKLPEGFSAGPIQWPVPEVKDGYFGKSFVYPGTPVFIVDITPPASLEAGKEVTIGGLAKWQICKESCINEDKEFSFRVPVAASAEKDPAQAAVFELARKSQAASGKSLTVTAQAGGGDIELTISPAGSVQGTPVDFIPNEPFVQPVSAGGSIQRDGDAWKVTLKRLKKDALENAIPQGKSVSGILTGQAPVEMASTAIASPPPEPLPFSEYLKVLWKMLVGGLILNLMPCVFPVIGLKIMGFVQQAGQSRGKVVLHGLTFTLGVLVSFWVISGILFIVRSAGTSRGWGFQLENPWVVLTLMILMFVMALNMFGVFEVGVSATSAGGSLQAKQGLAGSFFSGVLATVVATPCSAPFLGTGIAVAVGLPTAQFFMAFTAMALGMSLPYLVLSAFPKLIDRLPRPGAWMESFKQGMSFLLFATAGYLLWVYTAQIGQENMLGPVFGLSAIALAAWIYGRWNLPHKPGKTRGMAMVLTVVIAALGVLQAKPPGKPKLAWEAWSQERVDELLADGKPVYIDFTAQWCATCQVNKKFAYNDEVVKLIKDKGIVTLKADKTNPNPAIDEKLAELGRTAIPVNVLLVPEKDPIVTPEALTPGYLKELFGKNVPEKKPGT